MFWKFGGYDEALSGLYYGTTKAYRKRLFKVIKEVKLLRIPLIWVPNTIIPDASCNTLPKDKKVDRVIKKKILSERSSNDPIVLTFPYKELEYETA